MAPAKHARARLRRSAALVSALISLSLSESLAQLLPDRVYNGITGPLALTVHLPDTDVEARIDLRDREIDAPAASAPVTSGRADLYSLFPVLREGAPAVRYAQLVAGGQQVGPPVVLIPMTPPLRATLFSSQARLPWFVDPDSKRPNFDARQAEMRFVQPEDAVLSGYVAEVERRVVLDTTLGEIEFRLRHDQAPHTCRWFSDLVAGGFYTDVSFHRISPTLATGAPFLIQFGDPTGTGRGGPGAFIDLEPSQLPHDFGVLSMARGNDPDSNGSQVFICLSREGTQTFDGKYTSFAQCVRGAEVIQQIAQTKIQNGEPIDPPRVLTAKLVAAPPFGTGPGVQRAPGEPIKVR